MHMKALVATLGALVLGFAVAPPATAAAQQQSEDAFQWSGALASGRWVHVRNLNGAIKVEAAPASELEIIGRKRWRRGDPAGVTIEMRRLGGADGDVLVCAIHGEDGRCDEDDYSSGRTGRRGWGGEGENGQNNDVSVEFTIRVPKGVHLNLRTTNGALEIDGATAQVEGRTVNGSINASSLGGPVTARTTNGAIRVRMGATGTGDLEYATTNGSITIEMPASLNADVNLRTVNGSIDSEFPLTVQGRLSRRQVEARIGEGGRKLEARTVNGSIRVRRGST